MPDRILSEARPTGKLTRAADGTYHEPDQDNEIEEIGQLGFHTRAKHSNIHTNRRSAAGRAFSARPASSQRTKFVNSAKTVKIGKGSLEKRKASAGHLNSPFLNPRHELTGRLRIG